MSTWAVDEGGTARRFAVHAFAIFFATVACRQQQLARRAQGSCACERVQRRRRRTLTEPTPFLVVATACVACAMCALQRGKGGIRCSDPATVGGMESAEKEARSNGGKHTEANVVTPRSSGVSRAHRLSSQSAPAAFYSLCNCRGKRWHGAANESARDVGPAADTNIQGVALHCARAGMGEERVRWRGR